MGLFAEIKISERVATSLKVSKISTSDSSIFLIVFSDLFWVEVKKVIFSELINRTKFLATFPNPINPIFTKFPQELLLTYKWLQL